MDAWVQDRGRQHRRRTVHDGHACARRRGSNRASPPEEASTVDARNLHDAVSQIRRGRWIFRYDTFGDEAFWGDALRLHEAIAGRNNGGMGPGVSPKTALAIGLKVDADALPHRLRNDLRQGRVNLDDPATTLALLEIDAVVGVRGFFDQSGRLQSVGTIAANEIPRSV